MISKTERYKIPSDKLLGIYRGVVEERNDPLKMCRCKIRVFGIHDDNKDKDVGMKGIPTEELPWAEPVMGLTEGSVSGFGLWSVPLQGSHVMVFFENGNMMQPRFFATVPGKPEVKPDGEEGFNDPQEVYPREDRLEEPDVHRLARGEKLGNTIIKHKEDNRDLGIPTALTGEDWDEHPSQYAAEYPNNIVLATHGGITIELDNTKDNQRLHLYHPSNTYIEIDKVGNVVIKNSGKKYVIVDSDKKEHIKGNSDRTIDKDRSSKVIGNENEEIDLDREVEIHQNQTKTVDIDDTLSVGNDQFIDVGNNQTIIVGSVIDVYAGSDINVESATHITLKAPRIDKNP